MTDERLIHYPSRTALCRKFGSVQSLDRLGRRGDTGDDSAEILFQSFLQEALAWHWWVCPFFDVVHPAFPRPTTVPSKVP